MIDIIKKYPLFAETNLEIVERLIATKQGLTLSFAAGFTGTG